jgi:heptaprenyl diphosphate synthase
MFLKRNFKGGEGYMHSFWSDYPEIERQLNEINNEIERAVQTPNASFREVLTPVVQNQGKMLRAAFVLIGSNFGEIDEKKAKALAASIEMFHLATLVHDDIVDEAKLRRGAQTLQSKLGKDYAVYTGDFLLMRAMMLLAEYDLNKNHIKRFLKSVDNICQGEILQYTIRYSKSVSMLDYIRVISGKTAALFALSLYIGASESGCDDKTCNLLEKIGYNIGVAFQIKDDLLDFTGDVETVGKNTQADLLKGYYTLPIILGLKKDKTGMMYKKLEALADGEIDKFDGNICDEETLKETEAIFDRYVKKAVKLIKKLPKSNDGERKLLLEIVERLVDRTY